ncbi:tetratricopeptide repeat protein [soil metagenome]
MILNRTPFFILLVATLFVSACAGSKETTKGKSPSSPTLNVRSGSGSDLLKRNTNSMVISEIYIDASKAKMLEDFPKAVELYKKVLQLDPYNDAAQYELAVMYFESGQYEVSRQFIIAAVINDSINYIARTLQEQYKKDSTDITKNLNARIKEAAAQYQTNKWYLVMKADVLAYLGAYNEAAQAFAKLINDHPTEVDYYFDWAYVLSRKGDFKGAIEVYNKAESVIGVDENLIMQRQRLYLEAGMIAEAAAELQKLIDANPRDLRYYQMLAELYQATEQPDKAIGIYQAMLVKEPENAFALLNMAEIYRFKGDRENYIKYLKEAFKRPDLNIDSKIRVIYPYLLETGDKRKTEEAFSLAQIVVEAHPNEAKAHAIYGDLLYQDEQSEEALKQYRQALQLDKSVYQVWQQEFFILSELQRYQELEKATTEALELFPSQPIIYFFNGVANNQLNAYEKAVEILNIGKVLVIDNTPLKVQFYSSLGDAYNNMKKFTESDKAFEDALKLNSKNTYVLNNYSYYLSLRGAELEKAKKMSLLSNTLEPNNASFQDTYAWVLYKAGEYMEARKWIEKAISGSTEVSGLLLEHYGDILYKLGENGKALENWQKALDKKQDTSDLLPKKIADRKLYE